MAFTKNSTVLLFLLLTASLNTHAANLPLSRIYGTYQVSSYPAAEHERLKELVASYLAIQGLDSRKIFMPFRQDLADGKGGAELRLSEAYADGVRQLLSEQGLELHLSKAEPDIVSDLTKSELKLYESGQKILVRYAHRLLEPSEEAGPETIKPELYVDFQNWRARVGEAKSTARLKLIDEFISREAFFLNFTAAWLAFLNHDNLVTDLKNRGTAPLENERGAKLYFETLNLSERKREVRLQMIESRLSVWLDNLNPRADITFNPETREVFAHGLMMSLGELESTLVTRTVPLVNTSEIVDFLNRSLVGASWIYSSKLECGPHCLELIEKLSRYEGLIPYMKLLISARLGTEYNLPPKPEDVEEYAQLEDSMTFEKYKTLIVPKMHYGNLSSVYASDSHSIQVYDGLKFIDSWFKKHNFGTRDWSSVQGITLNEQRALLRHERRHNSCETALSPRQRPVSPKRWY